MVSTINERLIALLLAFHWIESIVCESITVSEQTNFSPCSFTDGILQCDSKTIKNNPNFQFQTPVNTKIQRLEILNFPFSEIPSNYFTPLANDLVSIKILSTVPIKSINQIAFSGCSKVTSLEIKSKPTTDEKSMELNEVFRDIVSLEDLKLVNLNFADLRLGYLQKLKSISVENSNLNSISGDTFQSNRELSALNIVGLKNASNLIDQFGNWPAGIGASISSLKLENCNLKVFPKFSSNFAKNLAYLSLAKNPIERIPINDTIYLRDLQSLLLSATKLNNLEMSGLKNLQKLKSLDLSDIGTIKDLPIEIEEMEFLESINFDMTTLTQLSITLPASIKKLSALHLKKPIRIFSTFLLKCNKLNLLNLNSLNTNDIKFLVDNKHVFKESLQVLNLDDSVVLKQDLWKMIKDLRNLEILYLNKANIDSIGDDVLNNLVNLKKLFLSGNTLTYETINTAGFQNIAQHLTYLDLSGNNLVNLPPCMFHLLPSLSNVNLLETGIDCDCNIRWLLEKIKSSPTVYPSVNFTCATGRNVGKSLYQLKEADLVHCSSSEIVRCLPLKSGFYGINFNLVYVPGDLKFRIENINGSHLRFMFDYMKVNVKQENKSYHSDIDKYELNRSFIVMNHEMQTNVFTVCLTLVRNMKEYDYDYNCRSVTEKVISQSGWTIAIGGLVGVAVVIVTVVVVIIVCMRRKLSKKKPVREEDFYSECSSEYSEPDETYQNPDQYTEIISNDEYTMDQKEAIMDPSLQLNRSLPNSYYPNRNFARLAMPSKSVDGGLDVSYITAANRSRFNKSRAKSSKRRPEFASLHNLNKDANSLPRKYHGTVRASLPHNYLSRDLPVPPDGIALQTHSSDSPPPKPKFPSTDIKNLLTNADKHINYFRNYASNGSLCTDESANHPHSGDSGLGVSKLSNHSQNRFCPDNSVII